MAISLTDALKLSPDEIVHRQARRDLVVKEIARLQEELVQIDRWLEAVSLLFPKALTPESVASFRDQDDGEIRSVWKQAILEILDRSIVGMAPRDIAQAIREGDNDEIKKRLQENPNGHYAAIERMIAKNQIMRIGEKYYSKSLYYSLPEDFRSGVDESKKPKETMPAFILKQFSKDTKLTPKDILSRAEKDPVQAPAIQKNSGLVYAALSRLAKRKELYRDGTYYFLPQRDEPNDAGASNGSDAGSDESPNKGFFG